MSISKSSFRLETREIDAFKSSNHFTSGGRVRAASFLEISFSFLLYHEILRAMQKRKYRSTSYAFLQE